MTTPDPMRPDRRAPHDLTGEEQAVAAWFARLERAEAPAGLRSRILAAARASTETVPSEASRPGRGRLLAFPFGRWGVASAAALLLALGAAVAVELSDPGVPSRMDPHDAARAAADLAISEDESLALYHGVEMFDEVGLAPGELIADWGR